MYTVFVRNLCVLDREGFFIDLTRLCSFAYGRRVLFVKLG